MPLDPSEYQKLYGTSTGVSDREDAPSDAGWGTKLGAAVDSTKAGLWGIGEAMGSDYAKRQRMDDQSVAESNKQAADRNLRVPGSIRDIDSVSSLGRYGLGMAVDTAPALGAMAVASRFGMGPLLAANYGLSLSGTLEAQRDQAGSTDLLSAATSAVPSAVLNSVGGVGGDIANIVRGSGKKALAEGVEAVAQPGRVTKALNDLTGVKGVAARSAVGALKEGVEQGAIGTVQEATNQRARMGVDDSAGYLDADAMKRYEEAGAGGLMLGGAFGARHFGRSEPVGGPKTGEDTIGDKADPGASLTDTTALTPGSRQQQRLANARADIDPMYRNANAPDAMGPSPELVGPTAPAPVEPAGPLPPDSGVGVGAAKTVDEVLGQPSAARADAANAAATDPTPTEARQSAIDQVADQHAQDFKDRADRGAARGVPPGGMEAYHELEAAHNQNAITDDEFAQHLGLLKTGDKAALKQVNKFLGDAEKRHAESTAKDTLAKQGVTEPTGMEKAPPVDAPPEAAKAAPATPDLSPGMRAIQSFTNAKGQPITGLARERLFTMLGLDEQGHPVGDRMTMEEVAKVESQVRGEGAEPVTKQAVQKQLAPFNLDEQAVSDLYDQIHGSQHGMEGNVHVEGAGDEANVAQEAPERERVTDSDQSEQQGAIGTQDTSGATELGAEDTGETGHMRVVDSANQNVAVEETTAEQRKQVLDTLVKGREYNGAQKAAFDEARRTGNVEKLLKDKVNFSDAERAQLGVLFEHGKTSVAQAASDANVAREVNRRLGRVSEHDQFVREKIAAENKARRDAEDQKRAEAKAVKDEFEAADVEVSADDRTLRMHLMDPNKVRQARLIGRSLADAKAAWDRLYRDHITAKDPNDHLPTWQELSPREQSAFVRTVDWQNHEVDNAPHVKEGKIAGKAYETQELQRLRAADETRAAAKEATAQSPEFQAKAREARNAEETATTKRLADEAAKRKTERDAERAAKKQEKTDGKQDTQSARPSEPTQPAEAEAEPASGPVGRQDGEQVQRGRTDAAAEQVPERGAGGAPDTTAEPAHGPGRVRGADELAETTPSAAGDRADVATRSASGSDVDIAPKVRDALHEVATVEPIEGGVQLDDGKWVDLDTAVAAAMHGMSPREQGMPYQFNRVLRIRVGHGREMVEAVKEASDSPEVQSIERLNRARDDSPAPLTVTASAGTQGEGGVPRTPSVTRVVRKAKGELEEGRIGAEDFASRTNAALDAADAARQRKALADRVRGADRIQEQLLAARRRGELSDEGVEMANWFIRQNPDAVRNLGLSVRARAKGEEGASGHYNPVSRIVTLMKGSLNHETAIHEILHHLERMMPAPLQNAIRREWVKTISKAYEGAKKAGNENLTAYYKALMDYHFEGGNPKLLDHALDMLHSGKVGYEHYGNFNPSEFWAVNGSRIVQGRFGVDGSMVGRIKNWVGEFVQRAKAMLGMRSDNAVIRGLDSIAHSDGNFTSGMMLQDQPGVHFMYAGEKTAVQEQRDQLQKYEWMRHGGATANEARLATGWFRNPADGKMRYELSDHDAEFTSLRPPERMEPAGANEEPKTYKLSEVLDHPSLFEAYPDARDINVTRQLAPDDGAARVQGWFNPDSNTVNITPHAKDPLSTMVHELQHWVQTKEGHAVGGSPEQVVHAMSEEQRARLLERVLKEQEQPDYEHVHSVEDREYLQSMAEDGDPDALAQLGAGTEALLRAYKHIAGEIEARDTQARLDMTPKTRADTTPLTSEKVTPKDVVTIMHSAEPAVRTMFNVERPVEERERTFDKAVKTSLDAMPPAMAHVAKYQGEALKGGIKALVRVLTFTEDLARQAKEGLPSVVKYVKSMQETGVARHRREEAIARIRDRVAAIGKGEQTKVNALLKESTTKDAWAYQPEHLKEFGPMKVDPELAARFKELSPAAQGVVKEVFEHGYNDLQSMKRAVNESVSAEYDGAIAQALDSGDVVAAQQAREAKAEALAQYGRLMATNATSPYAPLKRFGNFVVTAKSEAYMKAESAAKTDAQKVALREMQSDPKHYYVAFRETRAEAKMHSDEMAGKYAFSEHFAKDTTYDSIATGAMMAGFERMRRAAEGRGKLGEQTNTALKRMLTDLHYSLLSEASARHSERQRLGVAGADDDMLKSFLTKGRATAQFISMLENNGEAQNALSEMRKEAGKSGVVGGMTREARTDAYNELIKRHTMGMDWKPTPNVDAALKASSYYTLLSSPASWFVNATQPFVISMPVIAGRHGLMRSSAAMTRAYREMTGPLAKAAWKGKISEEAMLAMVPEDARAGVKELMDRGRVSSDNNFDVANYNAKYDSPTLNKINSIMWDSMSHVEILNRLTTAVAAIRLENERGNAKGAVDYADRMIYETHGDYSGFNAPAWMRTPTGRILGQFRKFQLVQMGMYGRLFNQAFKGATPEERWVGKKALAYSMGSMMAWGGALGLPGAQIAGYMLGAIFGDDKEPDNQELTMRRLIGDDGMADLLLKGVPASLGVDLSGRVGAGTLGNPLPFGKPGLDRKSMTDNVTSALGPFVGTAINVMDGMHKLAQGDYLKGTEQMLPKGAANAIKGYRYATQGLTQPNGDVAISPDEIGVFDGVMQGLGLPTTTISNRQFRASAKYDMDTFFKDRQSAVKRAYTEAYNSGDTQGLSQARQDFSDLQAHMKSDGYKPPKVSDLVKAPHEQAKRQKNTIGGVQFTKKNEGAVRELSEL